MEVKHYNFQAMVFEFYFYLMVNMTTIYLVDDMLDVVFMDPCVPFLIDMNGYFS